MSAAPDPPALEASLTVRVGGGGRAFTVDAELALPSGVLVLFGPSGSGKTLTVKALAGLLEPTKGFVRVGAEVLFDASRRVAVPAEERRIGYVPQQHALFPFLDVAGNVAFGLPRAARRSEAPRVAALLDELGLAPLATSQPASLSGGERQRVALARALAIEPRLLLLDEPLASIDQGGRAALRRLLREVIDRRRIPAVLVTHDPAEAIAMGDRLVRFERGRTVAAGDPRALLGRGGAIVIEGERAGPVEAIGEGRARVQIRDATIEGPAEAIEGPAGEPLRLTLPSPPRDDG